MFLLYSVYKNAFDKYHEASNYLFIAFVLVPSKKALLGVFTVLINGSSIVSLAQTDGLCYTYAGTQTLAHDVMLNDCHRGTVECVLNSLSNSEIARLSSIAAIFETHAIVTRIGSQQKIYADWFSHEGLMLTHSIAVDTDSIEGHSHT